MTMCAYCQRGDEAIPDQPQTDVQGASKALAPAVEWGPLLHRAAVNAILVCVHSLLGRGVRVAEGARLESVFTRNRNVGSNPTLSAMIFLSTYDKNGNSSMQ